MCTRTNDRKLRCALLREAAAAKVIGTTIGLIELANRVEQQPDLMLTEIARLERMGLMEGNVDTGRPAILSNAGRQYLERSGDVDEAVLYFLPRYVDDLHAREALMECGAGIVGRLRQGLLDGAGPQTAATLLPPAFNGHLDDALALDLFAASVALMARLAAGVPAASLAEENIAFTLIADATEWLGERHDDGGELTACELQTAKRALYGLYYLFGDADVVHLWDPQHPYTLANAELGAAELREAGWFELLAWWTAPSDAVGARS
jgi:hypothetical protein